MTIIKINAITVPTEAGDEVVQRFATRVGAVDGADGFEGFELLRPDDDRTTWLVVTRWRDDASFEAWKASPQFAEGHREAMKGGPPPKSLGLTAELWSYVPVVAADGT